MKQCVTMVGNPSWKMACTERRYGHMHFTSGINRPPYEEGSAFLQITSGCSHNGCLFCSYYKKDRYAKSSLEEIEEDVKQIPMYFGRPKRIFLQSANAFSADYDVLMKTAEFIHTYVPSVTEIGGYARVDDFCDKTEDQLRSMRDAGFKDPYIGVESGDDYLLKLMHKGYDAATAREQLEKLDAAGLPYIVNWIDGLGGKGYGLSHALLTAQLYRGLHPSMIDISSLVLVPKTGLWYLTQRGKYEESGEVERLQELQAFIKELDNHTVFQAEHISVPFQTKTTIPDHTQELIDGIQHLIDDIGEEKLREYRATYASQGYTAPGED